MISLKWKWLMNKKKQKLINESLDVLQALGFPNAQQNERSALTLLALLNLMPPKIWKDAEAPMIGIRAILDFCRSNFSKPYAENTRETFRRQTMHQFVAAGLVVENPDDPKRPINSPKWCYQIEPAAFQLLRDHFKAKTWKNELASYLVKREGLTNKYAMEREMHLVPVTITDGKTIQLSSGKHNSRIGICDRLSHSDRHDTLSDGYFLGNGSLGCGSADPSDSFQWGKVSWPILITDTRFSVLMPVRLHLI